jgi:SnoaL-like polyketide cyclase
MSTEENKALARRFYEEVWNLGNSEFAYEVFAEEYVRHDLRPTRALPGPAGQKKIADDFRAAFPAPTTALGGARTNRSARHLLRRQHFPL